MQITEDLDILGFYSKVMSDRNYPMHEKLLRKWINKVGFIDILKRLNKKKLYIIEFGLQQKERVSNEIMIDCLCRWVLSRCHNPGKRALQYSYGSKEI